MTSVFSLKSGILAALTIEQTAFEQFTTPQRTPLVPKKKEIHYRDAFIKIYTGVDHGNFTDAGGDLPDIQMYDYYGHHIGGVADPGKWVAPGSSAIIRAGDSMKKEHARQPIYTLFTANKNAICVALATISFPGLTGHYAWLGDWGSECAGDDAKIGTWYFGGIVVPGTNYYPNCLWIDGGGGAPATAFQVNWPDLRPSEGDSRIGQPAHGMCQTPSFNIFQSHDPTSIKYIEQKTDAHGVPVEGPQPALPSKQNTRSRRSLVAAKRFEQQYSNRLVIDDLPSHAAHTLCESSSSAGPSFVNPEHGFFCDMQTKTVHPVCKQKNHTDVCFDLEQNDLVGPGLHKRSVPFDVQDWRINRGSWTTTELDA